MAHDGKLDPVIGRAQEIETTIEVLARRKKNNPVLIGEPGVGKTAIVEGWRSAWWPVKCRDLARQAPGGTQYQRHGGRRQVSRRVRGARAKGAEGDLRAPGRADSVHRRGAHHRRCRRGRWRRRAGRGQRLQADDGARRAEPDRRHHAQRVPEIHREGCRAGAALPAGDGARADSGTGHHDSARPARHLRGAPQGQHL